MSFYVEPKDSFKGLTFVHIPKTGGTSIMNATKSHFLDDLIDVGHAKIADLPNYWSFAVFRDPLERAVSFYSEIYKIITVRPDMKNFSKMIIPDDKQMEEYEKGFSNFVVNWFEFGLPHPNNPEIIVRPSDSQMSFITENGKITVDKILDYSKLNEQWQIVNDYIGADLLLPRDNVGRYTIDDVDITDEAMAAIKHYYKEDFEFQRVWRNW